MIQPTPKILVLRQDPKVRRLLTLLLANAGCDVRAFGETAPALEIISREWFDAAILDHRPPTLDGLSVAEALRHTQPSTAMLLFSEEVDLSAVVRGIRVGINDIFSKPDDLHSALRRLLELMRTPAPDEPTTAEFAQVDAMLAAGGATEKTEPATARLEATTRELGELKTAYSELARDKALLEEQVKVLSIRAAEVTGVRDQQERQSQVIDSEVGRLVAERNTLQQLRTDLIVEEASIEAKWVELRAATHKVEADRRGLRESEETLRAQEAQLRTYEARLREMQAQIETARINAQNAPTTAPFENADLKAGWVKLHRAMELFENERRNFIDEKLAMKEERSSLKLRETTLAQKAAKLAEQERRLSIITTQVTRSPFDKVFRRAS